MELPSIKFGGIMGNKRGHVKDNDPQKEPQGQKPT